MIGLVLDAAGQHALPDDLDRVVLHREAPRDDVHPALGVEVDAGDGQAPLDSVLLLLVRAGSPSFLIGTTVT